MRLFLVGLVLILAGFLLVLAAPLLALASNAEVAATGGAVGCVVIFFVPICFGAGAPHVVSWGLAACGSYAGACCVDHVAYLTRAGPSRKSRRTRAVKTIASAITAAAARWLVPNTMGTGPTITTPPASALPSPVLQRDSININTPKKINKRPSSINSNTM
jgi:uncharacterized membrane protein